MKGNTAAKWHWTVTPRKAVGFVDGTGDEEKDAFSAQLEANSEFFKN
ncbi:hypothetical protein ACRQ1B_16365 [Rhizobium panacihumi]